MQDSKNMLNFKRYLLREEQEDTSHFLKSADEIHAFVIDNNLSFKINNDLTVDYMFNELILTSVMLIDGYIPFQMGRVFGSFKVEANKLKSLVGCPVMVDGDALIDCKRSPLITSLVGGPKEVKQLYKVVDFDGHIKTVEGMPEKTNMVRSFLTVDSYHNVHKSMKYIKSFIEISADVKFCMLGFVLVGGDYSITGDFKTNPALKQCVEILNSRKQDDELLDVKEQLMATGLKEFAKL